jgi:hypothetical protein
MYRPTHIRPRSVNTMLGGIGVAASAPDIEKVVSKVTEVQLPKLVNTVPGAKPLLVKLGMTHPSLKLVVICQAGVKSKIATLEMVHPARTPVTEEDVREAAGIEPPVAKIEGTLKVQDMVEGPLGLLPGIFKL